MVQNWRLISLLNTDNKILTKAMSLRLQPVLREMIHMDQTGFLPRRCISENLHTIQDVIDFTRESSNPALLLALDFQKAFDSVRCKFVYRAFQEFGFGPNFVDSIRTIFRNIESCVTNSGFASDFFSPEPGVRQGCCVSYLFLIAVEILCIQIRQASSIRGISIRCCETKLSQFADDLTIFTSGTSSVTPLLNIIETFGSYSGLRVNREKSQVLLLGSASPSDVPPLGQKIVNRTKILGLWFSPDRSANDHYEWNYKGILAKMRTVCSAWRNRSLSFKGKIVIVNSLVVSLLQYVAAYSPFPNRALFELKKIITHFLWNGGSSKVAYSTLIQPIEVGGLKLADFPTRILAARLLFVRRLVLDRETFSSQYIGHLAGHLGFLPMVLGKVKEAPLLLKSSPFYSELFNTWFPFHGFPPLLRRKSDGKCSGTTKGLRSKVHISDGTRGSTKEL